MNPISIKLLATIKLIKICPKCGARIQQKAWKRDGQWDMVDIPCDCEPSRRCDTGVSQPAH